MFENIKNESQRGGSSSDNVPNLPRYFQDTHERIWNDLFVEDALYPESMFHRRFRKSKILLKFLLRRIEFHDDWLIQLMKRRWCKAWGFSASENRRRDDMLAYDISKYAVDEYCKIEESTEMKYTKNTKRVRKSIKGYMRETAPEDLLVFSLTHY